MIGTAYPAAHPITGAAHTPGDPVERPGRSNTLDLKTLTVFAKKERPATTIPDRKAGNNERIQDLYPGANGVKEPIYSASGPFGTRLTEIVRELSELAKSMADRPISASEKSTSALVSTSGDTRRIPQSFLEIASLSYSLRRSRSKIFQNDSLFGEPAWDILLDLYIAALKGKKLSITDACVGSAVPNTTALRWISILQQADLLTREGDHRDGRRAYVTLTSKGHLLMQTYFEQALASLEQLS